MEAGTEGSEATKNKELSTNEDALEGNEWSEAEQSEY